MRHRYLHLDPSRLQELLQQEGLRDLFQQLLLLAGGDPEQALRWLEELKQQGHLPADFDVEEFARRLEEERTLERDLEGRRSLTGLGQRRIRRRALEEIFRGLRSGGVGEHAVRSEGEGAETLPETRGWRFGDDLHRLDGLRSIRNALERDPSSAAAGRLALAEEDLEVHETEHLSSAATVIAIDVSYSMVFYGEDRLTPAKRVAMALTELIRSRFPHDRIEVISFGDEAEPIDADGIPALQAGPWHTNTRDALGLSRRLLRRCHQPNKQIFLVTDGHPTAIREGGRTYKNPWTLDLKITNRTLEEAEACRRERIVITTFMLATDDNLVEFVETMTRLNRGRAYFASPRNLSEFVLADYVRNRRRRVR